MSRLLLYRPTPGKLLLLVLVCASQTSKVGAIPEYISNFANFTDHLVHILETSEPTEHRPGVHLYTPFSIGYLMANIYERLWPVPVREVPEAIFTLKKYVATDYAALLRLFKKRQFRLSSTIYTSFGNVTKPQTFPQLLTQVISLDLQKNRTEFRESLREILERGTKGHLENEMLPVKGPAWKEIFDNTTHGVYVNTLHYKSEWDKPWREIGERRFFDNAAVPFIELKGEFPFADTEIASAVIIHFQVSSKQIILFKPNSYEEVTDMRRIIRGMLNNESLWKLRNVTIQMPALNVTNLSQPSDKFPFLGVMDTFCRGRHMDPSHFYYNQHPIAHANHFEFNLDFLEITSASGSLVSFQNNKDLLQEEPPVANQTQPEEPVTPEAPAAQAAPTNNDADYFDILEATEEEDQRFQDYIIDARSGLPAAALRYYRGRGEEFFRRINIKHPNNSNTDPYDLEECDPLSALGPEDYGRSDRDGMSATDKPTMKMEGSPSLSVNRSTDIPEDEDMTTLIPPPASPSSKPMLKTKPPMKDDDGSRTLLLDTPFSWILRDNEIGEVFYGSVSSLCQYNRAVKHIPTVPLWFLDLFKAFYWRCV